MLTEILSWLATPLTALVKGWQDRKTLDSETQAEVLKAKVQNQIRLDAAKVDAQIAKEQKLADTVSDYDQQAVKNMQSSWKDEYILLVHTLPMYLYALPFESVHNGLDRLWAKLESAPDYWWIVYMGMVASTYGLRWLFSKQRVDTMLKGSKGFKSDKKETENKE